MENKLGLFRAKRKDNGEWIVGYLAAYDLMALDYPVDTTNATGTYYDQTPYVGFVEVDPYTVTPWTTLTDANNKRIFDGDILKSREITFVVIWNHDGRFIGRTIEKEIRIMYIDREPNATVIGNIFDNPELLGGRVYADFFSKKGA